MLKVYEDVKAKKDRYWCVKVECSICNHTWWVRKYRLKEIKKCPVCFNIGNLFERINKRFYISDDGCHIWNSYTNKEGYAIVTLNKKKIRVAKAVLERKLGRKLKENFETCHTCNNRRCINPEHLYEGTHKKNGEDLSDSGIIKGEKSSSAKIDNKTARLIKKKLMKKESLVAIARELDISVSIVENIKYGNSWVWLKID